MFDGQWEIQGPPQPDSLAQVPAKRGVLALLGANDEPIALLSAADMRSRLRNRLTAPPPDKRTRTADLRTVTRKVLWKRAASHFETDLWYLELARRIWPKTYASLLAWRPAWFVHVDPAEQFPHFLRTREIGRRPGSYLGPFINGRGAERFIDAVQDAFDLCRHVHCLRQSPHGRKCSYAEMERCLSPCDGTVSMEAYRGKVAEAAAFAAGRHQPLRDELARRIQAAADQLQFERAAAFKARLDRLATFNSPAYALVAPLERFRFVVIQSGGSTRKAAAFLVSAGTIDPAGPLDYPLQADQLGGLLARMAAPAEAPCGIDQAERLRIGLVTTYLLCGPARRGVIVRWQAEMTAAALAEEIEAAADVLKLRRPAKKPKQSES